MKGYIHFLFGLLLAGSSLSCNNTVEPGKPVSADGNIPANIPYQVVKAYPHDTAAFTEGLQFVNGKLYESTGNNGESDIRIVDLATGKPELKKIEKTYSQSLK